MAKFVGVDIQPRVIRAVRIGVRYRRVTVEAVAEVDRGEVPELDAALVRAVGTLAAHADAVAVAVDGEAAFFHRLRIPATAARQLEQVVPFELEAQVPVDIDDLVHDTVPLPRDPASATIDLLAVAVRKATVRERIELVARATGREPERVGVGALPLANLGSVTAALGDAEAFAIVELAEDRSEVVVIARGRPVFARTLMIGVTGLPASAGALAGRLRQTLAAASLQVGVRAARVFLTGVGAALSGAESFLGGELGVPVALMPPVALEVTDEETRASLPRFSRALGLALGLRGGAADVDLRRGALSYQRGFAFLKEKVPLLGSLGAAVLVSYFFSSWAALRSLDAENAALSAELAAVTKAALGEETAEPGRARELLDGLAARGETDPMPELDGFDMMTELSRAVPSTIVHDVEDLEFAREHLRIRGLVGSAAEAQQIADALKVNRCLPEPKIAKVSQVVNGARQKYVLEADVRCPGDAQNKKKADGDGEEKRP